MENKKITLEKLIYDLENLYSNDSFDYNLEESIKLANDIKKLQQELSIANDKLKKIEEYIYGHKLFGMRYGKTLYRESLINILSIIKGGKE